MKKLTGVLVIVLSLITTQIYADTTKEKKGESDPISRGYRYVQTPSNSMHFQPMAPLEIIELIAFI